MQLFALLLISGTFASFTKIRELGWSWCNLAPDRKRLFISLDACCLRCCLFPEPWLKSLKFLNSPSAQTARIFTRLSQWFLIGNNQMLNSRHLRSDELWRRGAAACFLFTSFTPLQASKLGWSWCNLAPDRKRLFILLDACCLRCCLFPEPWLKSLKFLNSGGRGAILRLTENACSLQSFH